ncbi:MAG: hypothetical protein JJ932_12575 [Balneolaceae bacterium]|nr:hypothetical protein [Balneolaceae bacterium]
MCFYLLFGVLAPLFLPSIKKENSIDKLMYSWIGLGGLIIVDVMILTVLGLYDFISLLVTLLLIPFLVHVYRERKTGLTTSEALTKIETNIIAQHVRWIENTVSVWNLFKGGMHEKAREIKEKNLKDTSPRIIAFLLAAVAAIIRIIPAVQNSAPFSRTWYFELTNVKMLSLQNYFGAIPEPKGIHVIVHVFSTLTQVTPELILHILGALTSFFLALIIYWVINVITDNKNPVAALFGMAIYAITPMYLTPIILDMEVEANSISLALTFAIPTCVFFLRQIRLDKKAFWFYIVMGVFATALINLFVFLIVLLPTLFLGLFTLPLKLYASRLSKALIYLILSASVAVSPYIIACMVNGISLRDFFQQELFDTLVFSYFPNLITFLDELSMYYLMGAGVLIIINIILLALKVIDQKKELVFLVLFALIAYVYTPYFPFSYILIDPDQLNLFYAVTIAVFLGIVFLNISRLFGYLVKRSKNTYNIINISSAAGLLGLIIFLQQGILISRALPETLPNGFFEAYYEIVGERVPYTYATVGPELDRQLALNRHFFMNYEFFLDNYGVIDSLYQQYLELPKAMRAGEEIPPASIFLFLEKPPYSGIQQGILYNSQSTMSDMQQWIQVFETLEDRIIEVYYESEDAIIYEIVNREKESKINAVLMNIFPENEEGTDAIQQ